MRRKKDPEMTIEEMNENLRWRARHFRQYAAFHRGDTDVHPEGLSGKSHIIHPYEGKGCWDTHPRAIQFSEWGHYAGSV